MSIFNDEILEVFANGILDAVAEYISNVIGYENQSKPDVTLEDAFVRGLEESAVDDSYERYGIETIFRLLEQSCYEDVEELDVYRKDNTDKVMKICINYYKKVFEDTCKAYPGITVDDFINDMDDYEPYYLSGSEMEFTFRQIMKILRDHERQVNYTDW